jgi:transcriptional regulator with XRE-family HTH domain
MRKKSSPVEQEVRRYSIVLRQLIRAAGMSITEVERRLGQGPKSFRRVLCGEVDLKLKHIISVLEVLDIPEEKFFGLVVQARRKKKRRLPAAELLKAFEALGYRGDFTSAGEDDEPPPPEGFDRLVEHTIRGIVARLERERDARPAPPPESKSQDPSDGRPDDLVPED